MAALLPPAASAQAPSPAPAAALDSPRRFEIAFGTAAPIELGVEATIALGSHFRLRPAAGWLPSPYVDLINNVSTHYGWYDQATADLIAAALQSSLVLGASAAWKPWSRHGFEVSTGYRGVFLGGASTTTDIVDAVLDRSASAVAAGRSVGIDSKLHAFQIGLGWSWSLGRRFGLRTAASYLHCFAASTTSEIPARHPAVRQLADDLEQDLETYLDDIYTSYVRTGLLHVTFGYRF